MPFTELQRELDERAAQGLLRQRRTLESPQSPQIVVDGKKYLSFCSNDYLGLANHPSIIAAMQQGAAQHGAGAGAAHLVSGHTQPHHDLETALAAFVGRPAALLFSTGYMANIGILQALVGKGDTVFADKLNHASLNDGMQLSRADIKRYRHCDVAQLEQLLSQTQNGRKLMITDAVFSMDGDIAPLPELLDLCERYDAWLLVDDAHGFGVLGQGGRGSLYHGFPLPGPLDRTTSHSTRQQTTAAKSLVIPRAGEGITPLSPTGERVGERGGISRVIYMGTLGKAAGVFGAFVASDQVVIDTLINIAHSYVYTTATPPALASAVLESLKVIEEGDALRSHLQGLIAQLREGLQGLPWSLMPSTTAIQPLMIGDNQAALDLSAALRGRGIWVAAIRPPTVPQGTARLRITLSAAHSFEDVTRLTEALHELAR